MANLRKERFLDVISTIPKLEAKHVMDCGTLAWGSIAGCPVYVRLLQRSDIQSNNISHAESSLTETVNWLISKDAVDDTVVYAMYESMEGEVLMYMYRLGDLITHGIPLESDMASPEHINQGASYFVRVNEGCSAGELDMYWRLYVPFVDGPNNSKIPVMWFVPQQADKVPFSLGNYVNNIIDDCIKASHDIMGNLREVLEPVNLPEEKEKRYALLKHDNTTFVYNRNHIGYNGNISDAMCIMPLILKAMTTNFNSIREESVILALNGNPGYEPKIITTDTQTVEEVKEEPKKEFIAGQGTSSVAGIGKHSNPLLNATRKANPGYNPEA